MFYDAKPLPVSREKTNLVADITFVVVSIYVLIAGWAVYAVGQGKSPGLLGEWALAPMRLLYQMLQ